MADSPIAAPSATRLPENNVEQTKPKLYLIDGSGYIFRAYYGMSRERGARLTATDGTPTNAVYVFNQMLVRLLNDIGAHEKTLLGIAFDTEKRNFRHDLYPEYKAHRPPPPEDLVPQFALIRELVAAWDIPVLTAEGVEADDILATLVGRGVQLGYAVTLVTGDKDLMQLVEEAVDVWEPMRDQHYQRSNVKEKFGVFPEQIVDFLALVGDSVDNIPGVPKIGQKTAADLLNEFGTLDEIYLHLEQIKKPSIRETLRQHQSEAQLSRQLASLRRDVPIALDEQKLRYTSPQRAKLEPFYQRLSFSQATLDAALRRAPGESVASAASVKEHPSGRKTKVDTEVPPSSDATLTQTLILRSPLSALSTTTITEPGALRALAQAINHERRFAIEVVCEGTDPFRSLLVGIAVALRDKQYYIPLEHRYLGVPQQLTLAELRDGLAATFANAANVAIGGELKFAAQVLGDHGLSLASPVVDTSMLSHVLDSGQDAHRLEALAVRYLRDELPRFDALVGKGKAAKVSEVELKAITDYASARAATAYQLGETLEKRLSEAQIKLYRELEIPLLSLLQRMEARGIRLEPARLTELGKEFRERAAQMEAEITGLAGTQFNIGSPKQLGQILFEKLGLPVVKKTKSGPSTDQSVLEELALIHPLPAKIVEYRQLQKLLSTYIETLPKLILPRTGRIHTVYNQALAATGRLSSADPNLQNIPVKTELGRKIREAFVPEPSWRFISADYSQIELRMLAHFSEDEALTEAFLRSEDIHQKTAMALFHVPSEGVTGEMRRRAKTLNFGLLYGLSAFRLAREEKISMAEAKAFIDGYFGAYPKVREYMDQSLNQARRLGYAETMLGRRRYLPDLASKNANIRQGAERIAINTPVQGSAADLIKTAMLRVDQALRSAQMDTRLLLSVHDELVLEAPLDEVDRATQLVREQMERALPLRVPLLVQVSVGDAWNEVH